MISPIILISTPLILITSFAVAFFFAPEIDPVLTLSISDVPVQRSWPMHWGWESKHVSVLEAYNFLSRVHSNPDVVGHFTCNIRYPLLDIKCFGDLPILTKSYFGASGDLLKVTSDGHFSFSWPSSYNHEENQIHVLSFSGIREIFLDNITSEEDQLVVDWYKAWCAYDKTCAHLFVSPLDDPFNPKCIKIVYYSHQVYLPNPDGIGCEGLVYDTSKLIQLYDQPVIYSTADLIGKSAFEFPHGEFFPSFRLFDLLKKSYNVSTTDTLRTFLTTMVHPLNGLPPQDIISVYFAGVDNYNSFDPGPISNPSDLPNYLPKALIFIVCATSLAFCTYLGYGYFG